MISFLSKIRFLLPSGFYDILKSYITDGKFKVRVNTETSASLQIEAGVPQGSVLVPFLYILFTINFQSITTKIFDDDIGVLHECEAIDGYTFHLWLRKFYIGI